MLIGGFGTAITDEPVLVEVVGEILTSAGVGDNPDAADANSLSFLGARVEVTPLAAGPSLIVSESVPENEWMLDRASGRRQGDGCPIAVTIQIVRVTWAGGISNADGDEVGEVERAQYRVNLQQSDGSTLTVTPFALADLGDGDNNHLLCLDTAGTPLSVFFPTGYLLDPNEDTLNPDTTVLVSVAGTVAP